jgi:transcriptional regulator with XRE-family HTH domain
MEEVVQSVARNLKRLRTERGITLSELARRAAMGKATLSSLEAGRANPTIETLWALATALGIPFGDLVAEDVIANVQILHQSEGVRIRGAAGNARLLERFPAKGLMELYEMALNPGECYKAEPHIRGVVEHVFVVRGHLETGPTDETVQLSAGDYVRFPGDQPHVYQAMLRPAVALVLMDYP